MPIIDSPLFTWVILPFLIFLARVCDVSLGTIRIMLLYRGKKYLAPLLAFFEILIWLLAIRQIFNHIENMACYFAFAAGFATGNYVGMILEEKLAMGLEVIRVITRKDGHQLIDYLKEHGYGVTSVNAQGSTGEVSIIYTIINRKEHQKVINIIQRFNPKAFFSIEDVKSVSEQSFLTSRSNHFFRFLDRGQKGK